MNGRNVAVWHVDIVSGVAGHAGVKGVSLGGIAALGGREDGIGTNGAD